MAVTDPFSWRPTGESPPGADSIAAELASRIEAVAAAPGDAMEWPEAAAALEREAEAVGARPAAAPLLFEAARIHEERLADPATALALHRRALRLDPAFLPNLRACRRLAMDRGEDALAAEAAEAEANATDDPPDRADLLLLRARLLAALGRDADARAALERAAADAPASFAVAEEAARAAAAAGDRPALADAYARCARAAADRRLSAHYLSAAAALLEEGLGELARAGALALDAFTLAPEDPLLRAAARRHAERLGRSDALAAILRAEAEASTGLDAAEAWQALAHLEERLGRPEDAIAALERGRAATPGEPLVLAELARLRETRGAWADAAAALEGLAQAHLGRGEPGSVEEAIAAKLRRAEIEEAELGREHLAVDCCRDVLALDRGNRAALAALGRLCARLGDWDGLLASFEAEAEACPDPRERAQRLFKAAEVLEERLGRVDDALARYREALALDPDLLPARSALERLCEAEGRYEDLCALLEADLGELRSPGERAAHLLRIARVREERLGDLAAAAGTYRRILEIEPASRVALPALAAVLERLGRFEEVAEVLAREAAGVDDPRRKVALLQRRAELLDEHLDDPEAARGAWEDVRAVLPGHLPALRALGRLHARTGRWEALAALFRAQADAAPDAATAADLLHRIGELAERRLGHLDDAAVAYREAVLLAPSHLRALEALARIHRARGDDEGLVEVLRAQAAARRSPRERAAVLAEAARIAEERLGEPERAIENHEEALRVAPGFAPALRALDRLYATAGRGDALAALRRVAAAADGADRADRLLRLARLEADRVGDPAAARAAAAALREAAPRHPAALILAVRLAEDGGRRAAARAALAEAAAEPEARAVLLSAAALELPSPADRRAALARAAALAPGGAVLAAEEERRLREAGDAAALGRFCEARREAARDPASRASWAVRAGEAWRRAEDPDRALAAFQAALQDAPATLPALRGARALFAARGDLASVRGTLQAEGAALLDPGGAAAAFLAAGALAEVAFADPQGAAADYRRAAERTPLDPEPLARLERLPGKAGAAGIAAVHAARARAEQDGRRAAESWVASARAVLDASGPRETALAALDRAVEAWPRLAAARELRARVRAEAGLHADALADLEVVLSAAPDPAGRLMLHLEAATLCEEGLGDLPGALGHLHAALALAPESPEGLARLARIHARAGRFAEQAAALRRLVDVPGLPPGAAVEHLLALADVDERLGRVEAAGASCRRALELQRDHDEAHRRLLRLAAGGDARSRLRALEAAAANARDRALRAEAHLEAARLLEGELVSPERARVHLRGALSLDGDRAEARARLADLLEQASPADAAGEHRRLLASDPLRAESWAALFRLFERTRAHDRAYVAASVLRWLGAPPPSAGADRLLAEGARHAPGASPPWAAEDLARLRAPGDGGPLAAVLEAAGDAIAAATGAPPERHGARLRHHPLRRALAEVARALGAPGWELYAGTIGRVEVEPAAPYAIHVGPDVARRTTAREQRFLVGRAAALLRTRGCLADLLPPAALAGWVAAAVRTVVPGWAPGAAADEEMVRRIGRALSRRARRALDAPARALARSAASPDLEAWRTGSARTADRAGLVLCGDVAAALGVLLRDRTGRPPAGDATVAAARARPDVLALLAFAATDAHFVLRQRVRVAIA